MLKQILPYVPFSIIQRYEQFLLANYPRVKSFLTSTDPDLLECISERKAMHLFYYAAKTTPAYQKFLRKNRVKWENIKTLDDFNKLVPATDKNNYVKKYNFEQRCQYGKLPKHGCVDESGGTSGVATNWIHDVSEESILFKAASFELNYVFEADKKNLFVISAWSSGPWATGVKFCELMEQVTLVKNTATDPKSIINTLNIFGKNKNYLLGGYPPFVKKLIDEYEQQIPWKEYNLDIITGGEGVTLEWVHHMKRKLKPSAKIISSYGASDIDIGIGFETPISFFIRECAAKNRDLNRDLFQNKELPMVFQYNPCMHYIREIVSPEGLKEFEITHLDTNTVVPKIKYNLHDEACKFTFTEMLDIIKKYEPNFVEQYEKKNKKLFSEVLRLPFLCIFGRSDGTLSFDGANVFPSQIEEAFLNEKSLEKITNRFKMEKKYDKNHNVEFHIYFELKQGFSPKKALEKQYLTSILSWLSKENPDYKESFTKNPDLKPHIHVYHYDHKLFKADDNKVKNNYIIQQKK